jgi:hypothetical protein
MLLRWERRAVGEALQMQELSEKVHSLVEQGIIRPQTITDQVIVVAVFLEVSLLLSFFDSRVRIPGFYKLQNLLTK